MAEDCVEGVPQDVRRFIFKQIDGVRSQMENHANRLGKVEDGVEDLKDDGRKLGKQMARVEGRIDEMKDSIDQRFDSTEEVSGERHGIVMGRLDEMFEKMVPVEILAKSPEQAKDNQDAIDEYREEKGRRDKRRDFIFYAALGVVVTSITGGVIALIVAGFMAKFQQPVTNQITIPQVTQH